MIKEKTVNFVDFWPNFNCKENIFLDILRERFHVSISDNPEYLFFSCFGTRHLKYDCIKLFYTGECITPNFNLCDYAMGFDFIDFGDRFFRLPLFILYDREGNYTTNKARLPSGDASKSGFCNYIYSNKNAMEEREMFFHMISQYKKVDSAGRHLNNIGFRVDNKLEFQSQYKFSIAFENTVYPGYTTEKIFEALLANTIPIYYGNPLVARDFNPDTYINCHEFENFEAVIERVIEIDSNNSMFRKYIEAPIRTEMQSWDENKFRHFLWNIFGQPLCEARRRPTNIRIWGEEFDAKASAKFEIVKRVGVRLKGRSNSKGR